MIERAEFTVFEDSDGFWFVPRAQEAAAIANPAAAKTQIHSSKIAACRAALKVAIDDQAQELHLHGVGAVTGIKREASAQGIKAFVYWASITTRIAPFCKK